MEKTFKQRYLAGEISFEEIDDYVDTWNNSEEPCTLREFLGLNAEEEDVWIEDSDEALQDLLDKQKKEGGVRAGWICICILKSAWMESSPRKGWQRYAVTAVLR